MTALSSSTVRFLSEVDESPPDSKQPNDADMAAVATPISTHSSLKKVGVAKTSDLTHSGKLEDQASTAALYVKQQPANESRDATRYMDGDKLSSAGAAASLKYANPRDLPSYPSAGLRDDDSAAGAAASLGWSNQKSFEYWKPDGTSASASKAAMLAKDYKAPEIWQPDGASASASKAALLAKDYKAPALWRPDGTSSAASKAAMLAKDYKAPPHWVPEESSNAAKASILAHRDDKKVEIWKPEPNTWGNTAATQAMSESNLSPRIDYGYTELGRRRSVIAANGAMSRSRKRAESTPVAKPDSYPDESNATANALSAATHANNASRKYWTDIAPEAGSLPYVQMPKEMFTSAPPVNVGEDARNRTDVLHASAIALARAMYTVQQRKIDEAKVLQRSDSVYAANSAHGRRFSTSTVSEDDAPMRFNSLQEAAQKLAHERLAKLHDEHAQNQEYRSYYADGRRKSRLSIRGRKRASSDGLIDDDQEAQKIRSQMSLFTSNLSQVDAKKRQADRDALMAAAQRNVTARLSLMDERAATDPKRISQSKLSEWEVKAHAAAQKNSEGRLTNHGRVDIGGGQYVNQSEIDLIARNHVQPILDEINENVEARREREAALKLENDAKHRGTENEKLRQKEVKDINKKLAQQDKEERKAKRAEEKAREKELKADRKRGGAGWKRKSLEPIAAGGVGAAGATAGATGAAAGAAGAMGERGTGVVADSENEEVEDYEDDVDEAEDSPTRLVTSEPVVSEPIVTAHTEDQHDDGYVAPPSLRTSMEIQQQQRLDEIITDQGDPTPASPTKPKGWRRFFGSRRMSKGKSNKTSEVREKPETTEAIETTEPAETTESTETSRPFVGGAALTGASQENVVESAPSSIYDVTPMPTNTTQVAQHSREDETRGRSGRRSSSPVSLVSSVDDYDQSFESSREDEFEEAQDHFEDLAQPKFPTNKSSSPSRASKFTEVV